MPQIRLQQQTNEFELILRKRVVMVHRWDGSPDSDWLPWLKKELEKLGYQVEVPDMRVTAHPEIEAWVTHLAKVVGEVDENTILVGHSIGVQTILRFLERLPAGKKVGGVVSVAGWFTLKNLDEESVPIARPWLETQIDFERVKQHCLKFVGIFSAADPVVPSDNSRWFEERLGAKVLLEQSQGHFTDDDGVQELPIVLQVIQELN